MPKIRKGECPSRAWQENYFPKCESSGVSGEQYADLVIMVKSMKLTADMKEEKPAFNKPKNNPRTASNLHTFNKPQNDQGTASNLYTFNKPENDLGTASNLYTFNKPHNDPGTASNLHTFNKPQNDPGTASNLYTFNKPQNIPGTASNLHTFNKPQNDPGTASHLYTFNKPQNDLGTASNLHTFNKPQNDPGTASNLHTFNKPQNDPGTASNLSSFNKSQNDPGTSNMHDTFDTEAFLENLARGNDFIQNIMAAIIPLSDIDGPEAPDIDEPQQQNNSQFGKISIDKSKLSNKISKVITGSPYTIKPVHRHHHSQISKLSQIGKSGGHGDAASELKGLKAVTFVVPPDAQQRNDTSISTDAEKRSDTSILTDAEKMSDTSILTDAEKISDTSILTDAEKISDTSILTDAEIRMSYEKINQRPHSGKNELKSTFTKRRVLKARSRQPAAIMIQAFRTAATGDSNELVTPFRIIASQKRCAVNRLFPEDLAETSSKDSENAATKKQKSTARETDVDFEQSISKKGRIGSEDSCEGPSTSHTTRRRSKAMKKSLAQRSRKRTALGNGNNKLMDCESGALSSAMDVDVHASTSHMNMAMAMDVSEVGSSTSQMLVDEYDEQMEM